MGHGCGAFRPAGEDSRDVPSRRRWGAQPRLHGAGDLFSPSRCRPTDAPRDFDGAVFEALGRAPATAPREVTIASLRRR